MSASGRARRKKREVRRQIIVGALVLDQIERGTLPEDIRAILIEGLPGFVPERDRNLFADLDLVWKSDGR